MEKGGWKKLSSNPNWLFIERQYQTEAKHAALKRKEIK